MGATRRRTQLRCCSARTGFEVLDPLGKKIKKGPDGAPFSFLAVQRVMGEPCSAESTTIFPVPREFYRDLAIPRGNLHR